MKETICECGQKIANNAMPNHLSGGSHSAELTRKKALLGREDTHTISCIYASDIAACQAIGYEIISDAFFHPGCQTMPGIFSDGVIHAKEDDYKEKLLQYRHDRKIEQMKKYREENREELLQQKKERYPIIRLQRKAKKAIGRMGQPGEDDRLRIITPLLVAEADNGLIIRSENGRIVEVVVKDTTTGLVHFLTVPPEFGNLLIENSPAIGDNAHRAVHAAIAWTFDMNPEEYMPIVQA